MCNFVCSSIKMRILNRIQQTKKCETKPKKKTKNKNEKNQKLFAKTNVKKKKTKKRKTQIISWNSLMGNATIQKKNQYHKKKNACKIHGDFLTEI